MDRIGVRIFYKVTKWCQNL